MKIYKVELLIIDFDNVGNDIKDVIENVNYPNHCITPNVMKIEGRDIGEWDDESPLNNIETMGAEYKRLFG